MLTRNQVKEITKFMKENGYNKTTISLAIGYKTRTTVTNVLNRKTSSKSVEEKLLKFIGE